jgi:HD superfamily phosphohydrolase
MWMHVPQDEVYGPLSLPAYCWGIIDTPEFQRMRHIKQLACCMYVYPGATHSRFEHCLGVAHLANRFMSHIITSQPELSVLPEWSQSVIIAALCHDLGHGPWSHTFEALSRRFDTVVDHEALSGSILRRIVSKYKLDFPAEVIEAAAHFILGLEHPGFPVWLSQIVANQSDDIDLDKFDYLVRDMNRTIALTRSVYEGLMFHCRIVEGNLAWRFSEMHTIERLFWHRNDMLARVYCHRVVQAVDLMLLDILELSDSELHISRAFEDLDEYLKWDDRMLGLIEAGEGGEAALSLVRRLQSRRLYRCVGELRMKPGSSSSQRREAQLEEEIAAAGGIDAQFVRVRKTSFRFGVRDSHPLLHVALWRPGSEGIVKLTQDDLSCIAPMHFSEVTSGCS